MAQGQLSQPGQGISTLMKKLRLPYRSKVMAMLGVRVELRGFHLGSLGDS